MSICYAATKHNTITHPDMEKLLLNQAWDQGETNRAQLDQLRKLLQLVVKQELTALERKEISLYYGKQMTMQEIATLTGTNRSTVCRNVKRALRKLQNALQYCAVR